MSHDPFPHRTCQWQAPHDWDTLDIRATVPDEPGYYVFTDHAEPLAPSAARRNVLYVGIATRSLRDRLQKYRSGDTGDVAQMHAGGFLMLLSRAGAVQASAGRKHARLELGVQRRPIAVTVNRAGGAVERYQLEPDRIYVRWAVDPRAAIERMLIRDLHPRYNIVHSED